MPSYNLSHAVCEKGTAGFRIWFWIQKITKNLDGKQDLPAIALTQEVGFTKTWAQDAGFFCLSVGNLYVLTANANQQE